MISPVLRVLGALAGLGSAALFWFFGHAVSTPLRRGQLLQLDSARYELFAFLFIPALILAVVALFWVPPRMSGDGPLPEGRRLRTFLVALFLIALTVGISGRP